MSTSQGQWHDKALESAGVVIEANEYKVEVSATGQPTWVTEATSVRYSPKVNSAKNLKVDVPPADFLDGLTYLGGTLDVYVDGDHMFQGEIKKITTNQTDGKDYTILSFHPGKKLAGTTVDRSADNEVVYDTVGMEIDRFNTQDSEHQLEAGTADETLNNVAELGGNVRGVESGFSSGTATYSAVGTDASAIDIINCKIYTPGTDDVTVTIDDGTTTYSETFSGADANVYGEWVKVDPGTTFTVANSYDLQFTLNGSALLVNWSSLTDRQLQRDVRTPTVEQTDSGVSLYDVTSSEMQSEGETTTDHVVYDSTLGTSGGYRTRQVCTWHAVDGAEFNTQSDSDATHSTRHISSEGLQGITFDKLSHVDDQQDWRVWMRLKRNILADFDENWETFGAGINDTTHAQSGTESGIKSSSSDHTNATRTFNTGSYQVHFDGYFYRESGYTGDGSNLFTAENSNDNGYGVHVDHDNNVLELVLIEAGSISAVISSTALTPTEDGWYSFGLDIGDSGSLAASADGASVSGTDSTYTTIEKIALRGGSTYWTDTLTGKADNTEPWLLNFTVGNDTITINTNSPTSSINRFNYDWTQMARNDYTSNWPTDWTGESISCETNADSPTAWYIDCAVLVHHHANISWTNSDFDNTLTSSQLDYPHVYANDSNTGAEYVEFTEFTDDENITDSTTSCTMSNTTSPTSDWGPLQKIKVDTSFPTDPPNSTSDTQDYSYPGVTHKMRLRLTGEGSRDTESPRKGFNAMQVTEFSVTGGHNDLDVIYNIDLSDNRLGAISSVADKSTGMFRWEGTKAVIFQRGQLTTDPDLRKADVKSSVSIEDTYRSAEVIGLHDVRSGVFTSADAPSYVDDHKEIRDDSIKNKEDAVARAKSFLEKNGKVQYEGEIKTLPTLAPVGSKMAGRHFNHGQGMIIEGVSYRENRATISLGLSKDISRKLIDISTGSHDSKARETGKGMTIPTGKDQF